MYDDDVEARARTRLGTVLRGKYRLDRLLGVGGMAVVYGATHRNQKRFAVKMLHPELSIREDIRNRFLREGYVANTVDHPGAVSVLDDDVAEDGAAFLVMELLEGAGVDHLWEERGRALAARVVLSIAHQLLDVLASAHAKAIVHRDIKPANLFVTRDGTVKVLDFGIARLRDVASGAREATSTGMLLGTPAFMAPEQALAKASEIDGQTDVWSVGAMMFTLLSGELVHEGENAPQIVVQAATAAARSLGSVAKRVDPRVIDVVDRALAFHKRDRWASAAAMRDAVRAAHLALFAAPVDKGHLAELFARADPALASTMPGGLAPTQRVVLAETLGTQVPPTVDDPSAGAVGERGDTLPATLRRLAGSTTAQPVSRDPPPAAAVAKEGGLLRRHRTAIAVAAATATLAAVGVVRWSSEGAPAPASASSVTPMSTASAPVSTPAPTTTTTASAPAVAPSTSADAAPRELPPVAPPARRSASPSTRASASAVASTPVPPPPPASTCVPWFTLDENGLKKVKPGCYPP